MYYDDGPSFSGFFWISTSAHTTRFKVESGINERVVSIFTGSENNISKNYSQYEDAVTLSLTGSKEWLSEFQKWKKNTKLAQFKVEFLYNRN